jgi:redox-sensitive bicupin YhaK (pirin superfamily)
MGNRLRKVKRLIKGVETRDCAGVNLKRIIASPELDMLDPFLLLDEFGSENPDDYIGGFPPHPHRGFETITYMINGKFKHKDTAGNEGFLTDGSVQWMTAGKGVIHSEMPEQTEGLIHGFQLWLNLPKKKKMMNPAYHDIPAINIPKKKIPGGIVKIIAGAFDGKVGPGKPHSPMFFYDIFLEKDSLLRLPIDKNWNSFFYVYDGEIYCNESIKKGYLAVLESTGDFYCKANEDSKFILIGGEPLNEPVARGGPFVMNTKTEILQAFEDYKNGKLS